jgi:hypothetical protein
MISWWIPGINTLTFRKLILRGPLLKPAADVPFLEQFFSLKFCTNDLLQIDARFHALLVTYCFDWFDLDLRGLY